MVMVTTLPLVFSRANAAISGANPVVPLVFGDDGAVEEPNGIDPSTGIYRGASTIVGMAWQQAAPLNKVLDAPWQDAEALPLLHVLPLQDAAAAHSHFLAPWVMDFETADTRLTASYGNAAPHYTQLDVPWVVLTDVTNKGITAAWGQAAGHSASVVLPWDKLLSSDKLSKLVWNDAGHQASVLATTWGILDTESVQHFTAPWQQAQTLTSFGGGAFAVHGAKPVTPLQPVQVALVFCEKYPPAGWGTSIPLAFGVSRCGGGTGGAQFYILPARFYMSAHEITAQLLPSGTFIQIPSITVAADRGSFCWQFSASGHISLFDQLMPTSGLPQQIRFYIDGIGFVFGVGPVRKTEAFGKKGVTFSGRSVTALLAAPYAREATYFNTTAQTAQQLAEAVLQYSGVTLDWGVPDWLVPAGAWSHRGTPLSAIQAIAQSIGGYVQSHRTEPILQVRHPYPELAGGLPGGPWNWYAAGVTPDVSLAAEALMTIGTERVDEADLNAVYVRGTNQGVLRQVKRIGTAGEKLGALITDPLITADTAAQQRGLSVLGAAGAKHFIDFELPILTGIGQPGILAVGQLALVNQSSPWRGRVRGVSASATFGGKVRQTINVERHLEIAP